MHIMRGVELSRFVIILLYRLRVRTMDGGLFFFSGVIHGRAPPTGRRQSARPISDTCFHGNVLFGRGSRGNLRVIRIFGRPLGEYRVCFYYYIMIIVRYLPPCTPPTWCARRTRLVIIIKNNNNIIIITVKY